MKVECSPFAEDRVIEIAEYISRDNLQAAEKWIDGAFSAVARLQDFPESGRIVPEINRKDIREVLFLYGNYRIVYRIKNKVVEILTARHGRQILLIEEIV